MHRGQQRYWIGLIHLKERPDFQMKFNIFKKKTSEFLDSLFWMGKERLQSNFIQKNGFG